MSYWDGTRWVEDRTTSAAPDRRSSWPATLVMIIVLAALAIPFAGTSASSRTAGPKLSTNCGSACEVGGTLVVRGTGFVPSAGGQLVILWVEYPGDYCDADICHGFYFHPWVNDDGTFSASFADALPQAGEGGAAAIQYNARTDKWRNVAYVDFDAR